MDLKNRLRVALGLEADVVLAVQEKLLDGTIVVSSAEILEVGADISVLAEDGNTILLAPGSYELENGTQFVCEVEGIISEILETEEVIEEVEETEEVEVEEEVEASAEVVAASPKKIKETTEYEFSKEEVIAEITNVVSELLAEAQKDVESIRAELSELRGENETLNTENTDLNTKVVELSNEPATEEIVLNKFSDNTKIELSKNELKKLSTRDRVKYNLDKLRK
tara:strand:+ start:15319 stop:15993 length:675 start_codon:yes stop_codon:yes gene_type:complete